MRQERTTHHWLCSLSIQCTTRRRRNRAERIGSSFAFSCSSIGSTCAPQESHSIIIRNKWWKDRHGEEETQQ